MNLDQTALSALAEEFSTSAHWAQDWSRLDSPARITCVSSWFDRAYPELTTAEKDDSSRQLVAYLEEMARQARAIQSGLD